MKQYLLAGALAVGVGRAQIPGHPINEYTTWAGTTFHKGDTIRFARGLREDEPV